MKIIIYGSKYGTARQYAEELGRRIRADVISYEAVKNINPYDTIIYVGALYAGGVLGMKKSFGKLEDCSGKQIIIATVGLADPADSENIQNIRCCMEKQLAKEIYNQAHIFHLRGGIDYSKLGLKHKTMMAMLYKKAANLPEEKKTADSVAMVETYNQKVNFVDFTRLDEIVEMIK